MRGPPAKPSRNTEVAPDDHQGAENRSKSLTDYGHAPWRYRRAIVPVTVIILAALFSVQSRGSGGLGRYFSPIMALWDSLERTC
jgi:hypothetical protein